MRTVKFMIVAIEEKETCVDAIMKRVPAVLSHLKGGCREKVKGAAFRKRGVNTVIAKFVWPNPTKIMEFYRALFWLPWNSFVRISKYLIAHRPEIWSTDVDGVERVDISSEAKVLVCVTISRTARSLQDLVDQAETG